MYSIKYTDSVIEVLLNHSCNLKAGDVVIVESIDIPSAITEKLVEKVFAIGAIPVIMEKSSSSLATFAKNASSKAYAVLADNELHVMRKATHFVGLRNFSSINALSTVPKEQMKILLDGYIRPVHYEYRNKHLKWIYLRWPTEADIYQAKIESGELEYYFNSILVDYGKLLIALIPLKSLMESTRNVRIKGPGITDLSFELGGYGVYSSVGEHNLPDGEIFTSPVRTSVNGIIEFNIDSLYYGINFQNVRLYFENGKVVDAVSNNNNKLTEMLNVDDGARFVGEFALGVNPVIDRPIGDILFDEKINTSLHLALGNAYPVADNGNRSSIHWDLILDQSISMGGGDLYFDDILIRHNGIFVSPELSLLNP